MNALMKTVYDLLMSAPDSEVVRCRLAWRAVVAGHWAEAVVYLRNAALAADGEWASDARAVADDCERKIST